MNARITAFALALALVGTAPAFAQQYGPPGQGYDRDQRGGWDQPPGEFHNDFQRQAFHDGIEAARRDFYQGRRPDPDQHREFREPMVPPPQRHDYQEAFRRGYMMATEHMRRDHDRDYDFPH